MKVVLSILAPKHFAFEHGGKEEKKNGLFERRNVKRQMLFRHNVILK